MTKRKSITSSLPIHFQSATDVKLICVPLFKEFGFSYFNFMRRHKDGAVCWLTNQPDWIQYYSDHKLHEVLQSNNLVTVDQINSVADYCVRHSLPIPIDINYLLWPEPNEFTLVGELKKCLNIGRGITLTHHHQLFCDYFHFGTHYDNENLNYKIVSNLHALKRFCNYFLQEAKEWIAIATAKSNLFVPPSKMHSKEFKTVKQSTIDVSASREFYRATRLYEYPIFTDSGIVSFTQREIECMRYWCQGKTAKEIGELLHISNRTVETYLKDAKSKLNIKTRSELMSILARSNFDFDILIEV